jgi:hypothetical protein
MSELIDYAHPMIMAEQALKKAHNLLLGEAYEMALDQLKLALAETRTASIAVIHMKEKRDAIRQ